MAMRKFLIMGLGAAMVMAAIPWGINLAYGNAGPAGLTFYANSPSGGLQRHGHAKFVDSLPGLGATHPNNLGNFIPVATKMTDPSGHGDDYYEIGEVNYTMQMHSDLPATTRLRGYMDLNPAAPANPNGSYYLGPVIIAASEISRCGSSLPTSWAMPALRRATSSSRWTPPSWGRAWARTG